MQEINLYQSLTKPERFVITPKRAKVILGGWILLLACIFILQGIYATYQYSHYSIFSNNEKKVDEKIKTLVQTSPKIEQVSELEKTIALVSKKIEYQTNFIQEMTRYHAQDIKFKPAEYLNELSSAATSKVWLTNINFQNQGQQIDLSGFTLSSSQLTKFVTRLQNEIHFNNKPFAKVHITSNDPEKMAFILSTQDQKQ
jgi:Tfp pilus assembly protein PilN